MAPIDTRAELKALTDEVEFAATTEVFGNVAHRFSTYEKRGTMQGEAIEGRGVISTQFIRTPSGWKMSSMAWDDERPGLAIPDRYRSSTTSSCGCEQQISALPSAGGSTGSGL
jgi:hypothetical protein